MLRSRGRINPRSNKAKAMDPLREACRRAVLARAKYRCEVRIDGRCGSRMPGWLDVHEIVPRSAGGSITDLDNCVAACRACHDFIHGNPNWATANGWKRTRDA